MAEADVYDGGTSTKANGGRMRCVWLKQRMTDDEAARVGEINDAHEPEALHIQNE